MTSYQLGNSRIAIGRISKNTICRWRWRNIFLHKGWPTWIGNIIIYSNYNILYIPILIMSFQTISSINYGWTDSLTGWLITHWLIWPLKQAFPSSLTLECVFSLHFIVPLLSVGNCFIHMQWLSCNQVEMSTCLILCLVSFTKNLKTCIVSLPP